MAQPPQSGVTDPITQMNTYQSYVTMIGDPGAKNNNSKLQAAQELSENFEVIVMSPQYPGFLEHSLRIFLDILQKGKPHFIAEHNLHAMRKLLLEIIYRMPPNELLKPHVETILSLCMKLLELENEQNVLVCLRIIIELHKHFRPAYNPEIQHFLQFVRSIYQHLPEHMDKIFEPRDPVRVKDLAEVNIEALLSITYTSLQIQVDKKQLDGKPSTETYTLIPKGVLSLKVLQELPIIVVLMYQLYKQHVQQEVNDYIPIIIGTITLKPADHHRANQKFNKEVFVDFMGAQIKTLSFLAYIIRIYQQVVGEHSQLMVEGILSMLTLCPMEVTQLRKELLIAARHILATDLRIKFVPFMDKLFDESVLLGKGWTTHESLRPLAYSTLGDLVHHVRQHLPMADLARAVHLFSNNVHDETLPTSIQIISCKVLLNLVDCICQRSESEASQNQDSMRTGKDLLMRMLEVFVIKFKTIAKLQLPILIQKSKAQQAATNAQTSSTTSTLPSIDIVKTEDVKPVITSPPALMDTLVHLFK